MLLVLQVYHLELVCTNEMQAIQLRDIIQGFQVEAKIVLRKKYYVVYLKEGGGIADLLNIMEAHVSLMEFENFQYKKDKNGIITEEMDHTYSHAIDGLGYAYSDIYTGNKLKTYDKALLGL